MQVVTSDAVRVLHLRMLINKEILALRVPGYLPADMCSRLADRLVASELYGLYKNAPKIGRVGQAFFETQTGDEARIRYQREAVQWIRQLRALCEPYLTPIDKLRLELDEEWPLGAALATLESRKMFAGLLRKFDEAAYAEPHQDVFHWDAPSSPEAREVITQLGGNIYLKMPPDGGELVTWPVSLSEQEYDARKNPGSYGISEEHLPEFSVSIKPEQGDLVLINANCVHAVRPAKGGPRITWSCFVGYKGDDKALCVWS